MPSPEKLDLYAIKQRRQVQQIAIERSSNKSSVKAEMEQTEGIFRWEILCSWRTVTTKKYPMATLAEIGLNGQFKTRASYLKLLLSNWVIRVNYPLDLMWFYLWIWTQFYINSRFLLWPLLTYVKWMWKCYPSASSLRNCEILKELCHTKKASFHVISCLKIFLGTYSW